MSDTIEDADPTRSGLSWFKSATAGNRNPFPGLRPFLEEEQHVFFGRENQVDAMVDKLAATHFLAVVGTSGSGKSSLVNCGLRPALARGLMARAGTSWRVAQFRPGNDPIAAMARALASKNVLFPEPEDQEVTLDEVVETNLRMSKRGLLDIFEQAPLDDSVNLLVVVDQFEELFRYGPREAVAGTERARGVGEQATAFVNLLLEVSKQTPRIHVVLTMRSDFLGDCTQFPGLAEAINAGQYLVPRLTRDERRAAIEGPAEVGGAKISPVLLTRLVNDVGDNPDQLSILQHALNRTWARWEHEGGTGPLALEHYEAIGTMAHALDLHAERAYDELDSERGRQICERMFKALTDKTDPRGLRRPTTFGTLCALSDATPEELRSAIEVFRKPSRSFLMPPYGENLRTETPIDISHESLMRVWERLKRWSDEEAASARTYRRLAEAAQEHVRGETSLYGDPQLQVALDWRNQAKPNETWGARYHPGFAAAMAFLDESRKTRDAEVATEKRRKERELNLARKISRIMLGTAAGMTLLAGVAIWLGWTAHRASLDAESSRNVSELALAQTLRAKASTLAVIAAQNPENHAKKILLALESLPDRTSSDPDVVKRPRIRRMQDTLSRAIDQLHEVLVFGGHAGAIRSIVLTSDGSRAVTSSTDGTARVLDLETGKQLSSVGDGKQAILTAIVSPDGRRIVTSSADGAVRAWSAETGQMLREFGQRDSPVMALALTLDGTQLVTGSKDGTTRVFDLDSGDVKRELDKSRGSVFGLAVSTDGETLFTATGDATVRAWSLATGKELLTLTGHTRPVLGVAINPDGTQIATRSADRTIRIWDTMSGREIQRIEFSLAPLSMAWSRQIRHTQALVVGEGDDSVSVWAIQQKQTELQPTAGTGDAPQRKAPELLRLRGHEQEVSAVAISPDGRTIVTGSGDQTVRFWRVASPYAGVDSPGDRAAAQVLVEVGKHVVPRCLTIEERQDLELGPRPPDWCIDGNKYPYDTELWKGWKAGKSVVDADMSSKFASFADKALKEGGDARIGLEAAELSIAFDPSKIWTHVNLAHAHMLLGQTDLARREYLEHCKDLLEVQNGMTWKRGVLDDFKELRDNDRTNPLMDEVTRAFASEACRTDPKS